LNRDPKIITAIVSRGDRIPWDGIVVDGFVFVDESAVSGVSTPAMLDPVEGRNNVLAGSLGVEGWLKIESPLGARMYVPTQEDRRRKAEMNGEPFDTTTSDRPSASNEIYYDDFGNEDSYRINNSKPNLPGLLAVLIVIAVLAYITSMGS